MKKARDPNLSEGGLWHRRETQAPNDPVCDDVDVESDFFFVGGDPGWAAFTFTVTCKNGIVLYKAQPSISVGWDPPSAGGPPATGYLWCQASQEFAAADFVTIYKNAELDAFNSPMAKPQRPDFLTAYVEVSVWAANNELTYCSSPTRTLRMPKVD